METTDTFNFFDQRFVQALLAVNVQPDNGAMWDNLLIEITSELEQLDLQQSLLPMPPVPPTPTLDGLGIHVPAVLEPVVADGGLPQFPFSAPADAPTAQVTRRRLSKTGRARNMCGVCSKEFSRLSSLNTHMRSHTGEKPYMCNFPGCFQRFSVRSNLRRHSRLHVDPNLPRGSHSQYMVIDTNIDSFLGYRRYSDPFN
ncbi:hypothetical protein GGH12_006114 [Coemansia sp. RSA 1822]|nr:hypothetical protein LPJ76_006245 [Coemansia sp. RSA 638]KAJ2557733.1 hypothetical protein GGH12_006114 [Coemansia sp. RSA 1822]